MRFSRSNKGNGGSQKPQAVVELRGECEALDGLVQQLAAARHSLEQTRDYSSAQRQLSEAYRQFSELYDFLPIPYLLLDHRGVVQRANVAGVTLFGLSRSAIAGRPFVSLFSRESAGRIVDALLLRAQPPGRDLAFEARVATVAASPRVRLVWRKVQDEYHTSEFHVAIFDLTETQELQEKTRRAERERERSQEAERLAREASEAKDQFLATLSHELRTPLTPILSAVDTLEGRQLEREVRAAIDVIRRNVRAEARLIDDLLDVARITQKKLALRLHVVDLHEVLWNVAEDWRPTLAGAGIDLAVRLDATRHHVHGDPARLAQVCRNVLSNALKFTDASGAITISTTDDGDRLAVSVRDTGIGMTAEQAARAFEPFVQFSGGMSRRSGLGLGLVICRGIVDAHGGTIDATSHGPGKGTTITFALPAVAAPEHEEAPSTAGDGEPHASQAGRRLLLLEDHRDSAEMLSLLLTAEGFQVTVARSIREALQRLDDCDLVISDIGLPDGTGLEFMSQARQRRPIHAIALSGFGSEQDVERSLEAGFSEHLTKPVDFDRLIAAVRRLS